MLSLFWSSRVATRRLWRDRSISLALIVMLTVGMSAASSLFTVLDALFLKPLPVDQPSQLAVVGPAAPFGRPDEPGSVSPRQVGDLRGVPGIKTVTAYVESPIFEARYQQAEQLRSVGVLPSFFETLGVPMRFGRGFSEADASASEPYRVIVAEELFERVWGGDRGVLGRLVTLGGKRVTIVGVAPREFALPRGTNVWGAIMAVPRPDFQDFRYLAAVARLDAVGEAVRIPVGDQVFNARGIVGMLRPASSGTILGLFLSTVSLLVLMWLQMGAVQIGRLRRRLTELGTQRSLGATWSRLMRDWLLEGFGLALVAGLASVAVGSATTAWLLQVLPAEVTHGQPIAFDARAAALTGLFGIVGSVAFSLGPLVALRGTGTADLLRGKLRKHRPGLGGAALLAIQLALATTLLYGLALALHSLAKANATDLGFRRDGVIAATLPQIASVDKRWHEIVVLRERLNAQPLVRNVSAGTLPLARSRMPVALLGSRPTTPNNLGELSYTQWVLPEYFSTVGMSLLAGRDFTMDDVTQRQQRVILSAAAAMMLGPDARIGGDVYLSGLKYQVIGVVSDVHADGPSAEVTRFVYTPPELPYLDVLVHVRNVAAALPLIRMAVQDVTRDSGPVSLTTVETLVARELSPYRARSTLLAIIGATALSVCALAIYASTASAVSCRTRDLAIRLALGASPSELVWRLVTSVAATAVVGIFAGLAVGSLLGDAAAALHPRVDALDPVSIIAVSLILLLVAGLALIGPARRLSRIDPLLILRQD
jgi:putative ABC transport system permease protein